jgi:putative DNA primase/helicase
MAGDSEKIRYIQKIFGYSLTGLVGEQSLWFFYGTGSNGKGALLNTLYKIMGDYARWAESSTFMRTFGQQHPTHLADLCGARLVMCGEVGKNQQWNEERIKGMTGGDPIKAHFMRQDFFEYTPQFTLVLAGNHKPKLEHVDEAVRRRFNLVPFDVTIPKPERDKALAEKLETEWPQILGWAIKGCQHWQDEGLQAPAIIEAETDSYLTRADCLLSWIEECIEFKPELYTTSADLYRSFNTWTAENGEKPVSMRGFSMQLEDRARALGIEKVKSAKSRGFKGIGLLTFD